MIKRSRNVPTIQRQHRPTVAELGARPEGYFAIDTWLRNLIRAPDSPTSQRNAAAIELRYLDLYTRF